MGDKKTRIINKLDGSQEKVEEVISFEFNDTNRKYMVYTKNEIDANGNVTIYVTEVIEDQNGIKFLGVENDEEWSKIKEVLRELARKDN